MVLSVCVGLQAINENDIHNVVLSYLVHNCYKDTTESFIACTGMKQPADSIEDMEGRKSRSIFFLFDFWVVEFEYCNVRSW